jgi:hypothetical protein
MMPDPIRDALRAAALATMTPAEREHAEAFHNGQPGPGHIKRAAETVAAFLLSPMIWMELAQGGTDATAAAVERAARDE